MLAGTVELEDWYSQGFWGGKSKGDRCSLEIFWPIAFRERHSGPKVIGSITTTNLLSVPSFFLSQFPPLAPKNGSRESMAGRLGEAESILNECGKKSNEGIRFKTATCKKTSLAWNVFLQGWGRQAGAWGSSLREVGMEDTHGFFF